MAILPINQNNNLHQEVVISQFVDGMATTFEGTSIAFELMAHKPNLVNAPANTQENWHAIADKSWETIRHNSERFQQLAEILALFSEIKAFYSLQSIATGRDTLGKNLESIKLKLGELKTKCGLLKEGKNGDLNILKQSAENVFKLLDGGGYQAIKSQFQQIQELNTKINNLQMALFKLYDDYYGNVLPELNSAEVKLKFHNLQAQSLENEIATKQAQKQLLQQQLDMTRQKDNEQRAVMQAQFNRQKQALEASYMERENSLAKASRDYEDMIRAKSKDHENRMDTYRAELANIK